MGEFELEIEKKNDSDQVVNKRVSEVLFLMQPDTLGNPQINIVYIAENGESYMPASFADEKDRREISVDAGYISRKFNPHGDGFVRPSIYDPEANSYSDQFKGHFIVNNGVREIHNDYLIGYSIDPIVALDDDIPYKDKVFAISAKLSTCMASSQNLDLVNKSRFRFFANDKELVNPNTVQNVDLRHEAWRNNIQTIKQEFSLVAEKDDTRQY